MNTISKDTWKNLQAQIVRGETIPTFYLPFLTPSTGKKLLLLASISQNTKFEEQLRRYTETAKTPTVTPKQRAKVKIKPPAARPSDPIDLKKLPSIDEARKRIQALRGKYNTTEVKIPTESSGASNPERIIHSNKPTINTPSSVKLVISIPKGTGIKGYSKRPKKWKTANTANNSPQLAAPKKVPARKMETKRSMSVFHSDEATCSIHAFSGGLPSLGKRR